METAILALVGFSVATIAVFIPGVRATNPPVNSSKQDQVIFYVKKYKKYIGVFGGVLGAVAAFWGSFEQDKAQKASVSKSDTIARLNREMLQRQAKSDESSIKQYKKLLDQAIEQRDQTIELLEEERKVSEKAKQIETLQNKLQERSEQLTRMNEETYRTILGGDSFCYLNHLFLTKGEARLTLSKEGEYPLYDITIAVESVSRQRASLDSIMLIKGVKLNESFELSAAEAKAIEPVYHKFNVNMLNTEHNMSIKLGSIPFSLPQDSALRVTFLTRNGIWFQYINYRIVNKHLIAHNVLAKRMPKKKISNKITGPVEFKNLKIWNTELY